MVRYVCSTGEPFIGCEGYPQCRFTARYDQAMQAAAANISHDYDWLLTHVERLIDELAATRRERDQWQTSAALYKNLHAILAQSGTATASTSGVSQIDLKRLLTLCHPDRWSQGQPATELAHEITVTLNGGQV